MKDMALSTISSIYHNGNFKAETPNERVLLNILRVLGYWPTDEESILSRSIPESMFKKLNVDFCFFSTISFNYLW